MTNEEAIKELKEDRALYEGDIVEAGDGTPDGQLMLALDMAIEALEKQIPKNPKRLKGSLFGEEKYYHKCPNCGAAYVDDSYCPICGQALDWSGEDD